MPTEKLAISVEELAKTLGISRPVAYELIKRSDFPSVSLSERRIIIPVEPLKRWLEQQTEGA